MRVEGEGRAFLLDLHLEPAPHVGDDLAPLGHHLLDGRVGEVDADAHHHHDDRIARDRVRLDASVARLERRQRREEDLRLMRVPEGGVSRVEGRGSRVATRSVRACACSRLPPPSPARPIAHCESHEISAPRSIMPCCISTMMPNLSCEYCSATERLGVVDMKASSTPPLTPYL